jgi:hypothetical protein
LNGRVLVTLGVPIALASAPLLHAASVKMETVSYKSGEERVTGYLALRDGETG